MNFIGHHLLVVFFVPPGVLGLAAEYAKVFGSVVSLVAVYVVDDFTREKISSNSKTIEEMVKDSEERKKKALAEIEAQKAEIPAKVAKKVAEIFKNY